MKFSVTTMSLLTVVVLITSQLDLALALKDKRLRLLAVYPLSSITGGDNFISAVEAARTYINSRPNILPEYQIEVDYLDARAVGNGAVTVSLSWLSDFQAEHDANDSVAPIVFGNYGANGCNSVGMVIGYVNAVGMPSSCPALELEPGFPRSSFPNLYRTQPGYYDNIVSMVAFVKMIGWNKVALLSTVATPVSYRPAMMEYAFLIADNITVVHFDLFQSFSDDQLLQLKASDARIIIYSATVSAFTWQLLCGASKFGMTGPNYAFLILNNDETTDIWTDILQYKIPCSMNVLLEQLKITYWFTAVGQKLGPQPIRNVSLGQYDYFDNAVSAFFLLDPAEQKLKESNLSLSDYFLQPEIVAKAINWSAYNFRLGVTPTGDYEPIESPDHDRLLAEIHFIKRQINGAKGYDLTVATFYNPSRLHDWFNYSLDYFSISTNLSEEDIWAYGKAPKDFPGHVTVISEVTDGVFGTVVALGSLVSCLMLGLLIFNAKQLRNSKQLPFILLKVVPMLGCILLNVSAAMFAAKIGLAICYLERIFALIGYSFVVGPLAGVMFALNNVMKRSALLYRPNSPQASVVLSKPPVVTPTIIQVISLILCAISIVMIGFFVADPIEMSNESVSAVFDIVRDAYVTTLSTICQSANGQYRDYTFAIFFILCLILSSILAFRTRKVNTNGSISDSFGLSTVEIKALRLAILNLTGLSIAGALIVLLLGSYGSANQRIATSFSLIIVSTFIAGLVLLPPLLALKKSIVTPSMDLNIATTTVEMKTISSSQGTLSHAQSHGTPSQ